MAACAPDSRDGLFGFGGHGAAEAYGQHSIARRRSAGSVTMAARPKTMALSIAWRVLPADSALANGAIADAALVGDVVEFVAFQRAV